nr:helix-turn-helix domain-containing protein [Octadecabacter antarcticus]
MCALVAFAGRLRQVPLGADPDGTRRDITGSDRGLIGPLSLRSIARTLRRSVSTISREVRLNGGCAQDRAAQPDIAVWDSLPPLGHVKMHCRAAVRRLHRAKGVLLARRYHR